jgi:hypothetical protein
MPYRHGKKGKGPAAARPVVHRRSQSGGPATTPSC